MCRILCMFFAQMSTKKEWMVFNASDQGFVGNTARDIHIKPL